MERGRIVYISGAYSSYGKDYGWRIHRAAALLLISRGYYPISPICHSLGIIQDLDEDSIPDFWTPLEKPLISVSDYVAIILSDKTFLSEGVRREISLASRWNKPLIYIVNNGEELTIVWEPSSQHEQPEEIKEDKKEEVKEECSEEKSHQEEKGSFTYLGKLLDKMRTG